MDAVDEHFRKMKCFLLLRPDNKEGGKIFFCKRLKTAINIDIIGPEENGYTTTL